MEVKLPSAQVFLQVCAAMELARAVGVVAKTKHDYSIRPALRSLCLVKRR